MRLLRLLPGTALTGSLGALLGANLSFARQTGVSTNSSRRLLLIRNCSECNV
jgi:hypothetical protein